MKTYTFSAGDIEYCETGRFWAFINAMGYQKRPFPVNLIGSIRIRFEGFHPVDRIVTDPIFRRFALCSDLAALPLCLFCDLSDPAYRLMVYARMNHLSIIEQNGVFTYQPKKEELEQLCASELLQLDDLAIELKFHHKVHESRSIDLEYYLEHPDLL